MRRNLLKVFACLALVLSLTACGSKDDTDTREVLKVGMECDYAPFNWTQATEPEKGVALTTGGYCAGYDVQIAQAIADGLDMRLEVVKTEWDGLIAAVQTGTLDLIIAGMSPTAERKLSIDFSDNYYNSDLVLVVRKDGAYANASKLSDFSGAKVVAQLNTFHDTVIDQIDGVKHQTPAIDFSTMLTSLNAGIVDALVAERPYAQGAVETNTGLTFIEFGENGFVASEDDTAIAVGLKQGSQLRTKINDILDGISQEQRDEMMQWAIDNQ